MSSSSIKKDPEEVLPPVSAEAQEPAADESPDQCEKNKPAQAAESTAAGPETEPGLPPLTPAQFRMYNRLAEIMDKFVRVPRLRAS